MAVAAALIAGLIEVTLYVAPGFVVARNWVRGLGGRKSLWIAASTLPAYLIYSAGAGTFEWRTFLALLALAAVVSWWFAVLPGGNWTDAAFLVLIACGLLAGLSGFLYPPLSSKLKTDFIGHIMWLRLSYWALLVVRDGGDMGFGFVPKVRDWLIGVRYFAYCAPVAALLLWGLHSSRLKENLSWSATPLVTLGTFAGILWVVALSEELFARGVLQADLSRWFRSDWAGVVVTSILFGLVHLNFSRRFPNWRMVLLAGVMALFCGRAAQVAGSIRAGMVTHAIAATLFRVFLTERN